MKKLSLIALAVVAVMLFAGTAMALDVSWTGQYRVRGYYMKNMALADNSDDCETDNKFYDQRFRLQTTFTVHDRLSLVTRFDALDNDRFGENGSARIFSSGNNSFNFDRAYMRIKFPYFNMEIGRQGGGVWGTKFIDYAYTTDRIKAVTKYDNWTFVGIIQKHEELDGNHPSANAPYIIGRSDCDDCGPGVETNDSDKDVYYLGAIYKGEGWDAGLLSGWNRDRRNEEVAFDEWFLMPYWRFPLWVLKIEGEACYTGGEWDYRANGVDDVDQKAWAFNLNVGFDLGPVGMNLGYAHTTGDDDIYDDDAENFYRGGGNDWQPLLIMTGYYMDADLGCFGNLNFRNNGGNYGGYNLFYVQADWSPWEKWTFDAALGYAELDETDAIAQINAPDGQDKLDGLDDEFGWEFDVGVTWDIMPNLKYNAKGGYFKDGDFFEYGEENCDTDYELSFIHAIVLTF